MWLARGELLNSCVSLEGRKTRVSLSTRLLLYYDNFWFLFKRYSDSLSSMMKTLTLIFLPRSTIYSFSCRVSHYVWWGVVLCEILTREQVAPSNSQDWWSVTSLIEEVHCIEQLVLWLKNVMSTTWNRQMFDHPIVKALTTHSITLEKRKLYVPDRSRMICYSTRQRHFHSSSAQDHLDLQYYYHIHVHQRADMEVFSV